MRLDISAEKVCFGNQHYWPNLHSVALSGVHRRMTCSQFSSSVAIFHRWEYVPHCARSGHFQRAQSSCRDAGAHVHHYPQCWWKPSSATDKIVASHLQQGWTRTTDDSSFSKLCNPIKSTIRNRIFWEDPMSFVAATTWHFSSH